MSKLANNGNRRTYINCVNQKRKKKKIEEHDLQCPNSVYFIRVSVR